MAERSNKPDTPGETTRSLIGAVARMVEIYGFEDVAEKLREPIWL